MTTTALLDIGIPKKNVEGYPDPTCYRALKAIQRAEIDWAHQMDIDNDHTEESSNWVTLEKLAELIAGVVFMTATSRNHQKAKGVLAARFGFFDQQALDAGRFIYGTTNGPSAGWRS